MISHINSFINIPTVHFEREVSSLRPLYAVLAPHTFYQVTSTSQYITSLTPMELDSIALGASRTETIKIQKD